MEFPRETATQLFREVNYPGPSGCFKVLNFDQVVPETVDGLSDFGPETWGLLIKRQGTTIFKADEHQNPMIVPAGTMMLTRARNLRMRITKGVHESTIVLWKASSLPRLAASLEKSKRFVMVQSVLPHHRHTVSILQGLVDDPHRHFELMMVGLLYTTIGVMISGKDELNLSAIDQGYPDSMKPLIDMVRKEPARYWPVPEAANIVGYSDHHFSRMFKQATGMKFQSFVERCRTAYAVELLINTKLSVDTIANKTGFGAPQALREAFKDVLGIIPSDLRGFNHVSKP
ncbi:MAG: helix-turn-helix transcriptional regulator [Armatimonadetes bacterium]|nr:helix-turn-helix transcriptional regulator [Armatimonadota bacterium]